MLFHSGSHTIQYHNSHKVLVYQLTDWHWFILFVKHAYAVYIRWRPVQRRTAIHTAWWNIDVPDVQLPDIMLYWIGISWCKLGISLDQLYHIYTRQYISFSIITKNHICSVIFHQFCNIYDFIVFEQSIWASLHLVTIGLNNGSFSNIIKYFYKLIMKCHHKFYP